MSKEIKKGLEKDRISKFYMKLEISEFYDPITTFKVEVPSKMQNASKIKEAKQ